MYFEPKYFLNCTSCERILLYINRKAFNQNEFINLKKNLKVVQIFNFISFSSPKFNLVFQRILLRQCTFVVENTLFSFTRRILFDISISLYLIIKFNKNYIVFPRKNIIYNYFQLTYFYRGVYLGSTYLSCKEVYTFDFTVFL